MGHRSFGAGPGIRPRDLGPRGYWIGRARPGIVDGADCSGWGRFAAGSDSANHLAHRGRPVWVVAARPALAPGWGLTEREGSGVVAVLLG